MEYEVNGAELGDWVGTQALYQLYRTATDEDDVGAVRDDPEVRGLLRNLTVAELDRLGAAAYTLHALCELAMDDVGGFLN